MAEGLINFHTGIEEEGGRQRTSCLVGSLLQKLDIRQNRKGLETAKHPSIIACYKGS